MRNMPPVSQPVGPALLIETMMMAPTLPSIGSADVSMLLPPSEASISGGTDLCACFVMGAEILPVWTGEIQVAALGMAVDVWDEDGHPIVREKGELVCTKPFPSMPIGFWNDPDGEKYHSAYFERFDNVWCHGDFAEWTVHDGIVIHGRSDATLNPGGVRIGTLDAVDLSRIDNLFEGAATAAGTTRAPRGILKH